MVWGGTLFVALASACGSHAQPVAEAAPSALNQTPAIGDFAIITQNSISILDRSEVHGGDVGVRATGNGIFLVSGYELACSSGAAVDLSHTVLADQALLNGAAVGDVRVA